MAKKVNRIQRASLSELGIDLRGWRLQRGLTAKQLAARLGVSSPLTISSWENGRSVPRSSMLEKMMDMMGIDNASGGATTLIGGGRVIEVSVDGIQFKADGGIVLRDDDKNLTVNLKMSDAMCDSLGRLMSAEE